MHYFADIGPSFFPVIFNKVAKFLVTNQANKKVYYRGVTDPNKTNIRESAKKNLF